MHDLLHQRVRVAVTAEAVMIDIVPMHKAAAFAERYLAGGDNFLCALLDDVQHEIAQRLALRSVLRVFLVVTTDKKLNKADDCGSETPADNGGKNCPCRTITALCSDCDPREFSFALSAHRLKLRGKTIHCHIVAKDNNVHAVKDLLNSHCGG